MKATPALLVGGSFTQQNRLLDDACENAYEQQLLRKLILEKAGILELQKLDEYQKLQQGKNALAVFLEKINDDQHLTPPSVSTSAPLGSLYENETFPDDNIITINEDDIQLYQGVNPDWYHYVIGAIPATLSAYGYGVLTTAQFFKIFNIASTNAGFQVTKLFIMPLAIGANIFALDITESAEKLKEAEHIYHRKGLQGLLKSVWKRVKKYPASGMVILFGTVGDGVLIYASLNHLNEVKKNKFLRKYSHSPLDM